MAERQYHGLWLEEQLEDIKGWKKYEQYTSPFDLFVPQINMFQEIKQNIQSKCIGKGNAIEMGDIFKNGKKEQDFLLVITLYDELFEVSKGKKIPNKVVEYMEIEVDHEKWNRHFVLPDDIQESWKHWITNEVSNEYSYDAQWKIDVATRKEEWSHYGENAHSLVQPRFKRDHKKQRRIQCAVKAKDLDTFIYSVKKRGEFCLLWRRRNQENQFKN